MPRARASTPVDSAVPFCRPYRTENRARGGLFPRADRPASRYNGIVIRQSQLGGGFPGPGRLPLQLAGRANSRQIIFDRLAAIVLGAPLPLYRRWLLNQLLRIIVGKALDTRGLGRGVGSFEAGWESDDGVRAEFFFSGVGKIE